MSKSPVNLDYEIVRPPQVGRFHILIMFIPTALSAFAMLGVINGILIGGFPDEGPFEAAIWGIISAALGMIGVVLTWGRSNLLMICNLLLILLAGGGFWLAAIRG